MTSTSTKLILQVNEAWLQEKRRTTWGILLVLFPEMIPKVRDIPAAAVRIADILLGMGYVPTNSLGNNVCDLEWERFSSGEHDPAPDATAV